ncbi:MAG: SDR family NAD(P)-dependent oxidoreductase [Gemmatimonadetes bacterium]|nr:SDR family NAD(P)-dependent oxidoreductase [Gemmatimonadota bacterium]
MYAGARRRRTSPSCPKIANAKRIRLDVTSADDLAAAVTLAEREGRGLYGVVNNAGIAVGGALVSTEEKELQSVLDVNVMGPWRVTKAFAPMLIASKGRVVTVSSISGILSGPLLGVYSMSKHAIEAFGDALGAEMAPMGVTSSLIEPGNYKSDIGRNTMAQAQAATDQTRDAVRGGDAGLRARDGELRQLPGARRRGQGGAARLHEREAAAALHGGAGGGTGGGDDPEGDGRARAAQPRAPVHVRPRGAGEDAG